MRDRQVFEEYKLPNGVEVYYYPMDVLFGASMVSVPFGTVHNTGEIMPGAAHFLEHTLFHRSKAYPEKSQFERKIKLEGGYMNATTRADDTHFYMDVPQELKPWAWQGLLQQIFSPIFNEEDLVNERTIISNERKMRERWWPGENEIGNHIYSEWMKNENFSIWQLFGSDDDLAALNVSHLEQIHKKYFSKPLRIVVGGNLNIKETLKSLEEIQVEDTPTIEHYIPSQWGNSQYHEKTFRDIAHPVYFWGGVNSSLPDFQTTKAVTFIIRLLTNSVQGVLFEWLRRDKGWAYGIYHSIDMRRRKFNWIINIPVSKKDQVQKIRAEIHSRVVASLDNQTLLDQEVNRRKNESVFRYQTLDSILEGAESDLDERGRIVSEKEFYEVLDQCRNRALLKDIYEKYFSPEVTGEFCALPEKE